jgi:hypothetical protein
MSFKSFITIIGLVLSPYFSALAQADVFNAGEFRLSKGEEEGSYLLFAKLPTAVVNSSRITLPEQCTLGITNKQSRANLTLINYEFDCSELFLAEDKIVTPWYLDGASLTVSLGNESFDTTLKRSLNTIEIPLSAAQSELSTTAVIQRYLWQGMLHIWFGWDHLAFVLCLCLLAKGKRLLTLITAFTIGHSLTLVLAFYQVVTIAIAPIEVLIAVSLILMAREGIELQRKQHEFALLGSMGVVVLFGLIHGLGFASALSELGVPQNEVGLALIFFNIGVELGQIAFIASLFVLYQLVKPTGRIQLASITALYFVGCLGTFWAVERLVSF